MWKNRRSIRRAFVRLFFWIRLKGVCINAKMTIKEAENVLKEIMNEEDDRFQLLMKDERKGVQKLVLKWYKQKELEQKEKENFLKCPSMKMLCVKKGSHISRVLMK